MTKSKMLEIPVDKIAEFNIDKSEIPLIELEMLKNSIKMNGLITPIIVKGNSGKYLLISGRKRLEAVKLCGMTQISAIVLECNTSDAILLSLAECYHEKNGYIKQGIIIKTLIEKWKITPTEIAKSIGVTTEEITRKMIYTKFSEKEIKMIIDGNINENHVKLAVKLKGAVRTKFLYYIVYRNLNYMQAKMLYIKIIENSGIHTNRPKNLLIDDRLILNTLKNSVNSMNKLGIRASMNVSEDDENSIYIINVKKIPPPLTLIS